MIFDALLQIDEGTPRATASLLSLTDLGRRRDEQRQAMQWLAAEIADNCEDEGLRAAALHTAELCRRRRPTAGGAAAATLAVVAPFARQQVSELAADNWRRPSETATPRRLSGAVGQRARRRSPRRRRWRPPTSRPGPTSRRAAAARRPPASGARDRSPRSKRSSRAIPAAAAGACDVCGVKAQFYYLYAPLASAAAASRSNALSSSRSRRAIRHHSSSSLPAGGAAAIGARSGADPLVHGACRRRLGSVEGGGGRGAAEERGPRVAVVATRLLSHARECPRLANVGAAEVSEERRRRSVVAVLAARAARRRHSGEEGECGAHQLRRPRSARRELNCEIIADAVPCLRVGEAGGAQQGAYWRTRRTAASPHAAAIAWTRIDTTSSSIGGGDMPSPTVGEKPYR